MESIELNVYTPVILSGNDLKGEVLIITSEAMQAKKLILVFTGKEKTYFKKQSRSGKYFKEYIGKVKTVRIETVLHEWNEGVIPIGSQKLSFVMESPFNLSSSFELQSSKASGSIQYFLKAKLEDIHMFHLAKTKKKIFIIQSLPEVDSLITEFETPINMCSCIYRGFCKTDIELSRKHFRPNDSLSIRVKVDNSHARVDVNSLECILWLVCRFISNENQIHYFRKCVFLHQHNESIKYKDSAITPKEISLQIPLKHPKFALDLCPVTLGRILQCTYSLQVSLEYGTIIHEEPDMQMPIYVAFDEYLSGPNEDPSAVKITRKSYEGE